MFSLVLKTATLKQILENKDTLVGRIIEKCKRIYVDDPNDDYFSKTEGDTCKGDLPKGMNWTIKDKYNKDKDNDKSVKDLIQKIESGDYHLVLELPNSAFILDISRDDSKKIQDLYGVICLSTQNGVKTLDEDIKRSLSTIYPHYKFISHTENWDTFLKLPKPITPSNSLIINDRYIFSKEIKKICKGDEDEIASSGIDNLKYLLKSLLPLKESFCPDDTDTEFNVLIISDIKIEDNKERDERVKSFIAQIGRLADGLRTNEDLEDRCKFSIDLILTDGIKNEYSFTNITHNRAIYSNYYTITVDHALSAFNQAYYYPQNVYISRLFSWGLRDKDYNDMPLKGHDYSIECLRKSIKKFIETSGDNNPVENEDPLYPFVKVYSCSPGKVYHCHFGKGKPDPKINRLFWG